MCICPTENHAAVNFVSNGILWYYLVDGDQAVCVVGAGGPENLDWIISKDSSSCNILGGQEVEFGLGYL